MREQYELSGTVAPTMSQIDSQALAEAVYATSGVPELMRENIPTFEPATAALMSLLGRASQPLFTWAGTQGARAAEQGVFPLHRARRAPARSERGAKRSG